jgi:hypothetical protein
MRIRLSCNSILLVGFMLFLVHTRKTTTWAQEQGQQGVVAGYLPDYRSYINVNATAPHLTDLILFSIQPNSRGMIGGCCLDSQHYELGRQARSLSPSLKLWVTIGGGGRSEAIPSIVQDPQKRSLLIQGMLRLA